MSASALRAGAFAAAWSGAAAGLGLLPSGAGFADGFALLAWLVFAVPAIGALAGGSLRPWAAGLGALLGLTAVGALGLALGTRGLPQPPGGAAVVAGLFGLGFGLGALARWLGPTGPLRAAALLTLLVALGSALPVRGGLSARGPAEVSPRVASLLLDLSPLTLAFECAGVDWMRHPGIYGPAGTDWFSDTRTPWSAGLAGSGALLLGCLSVLVGLVSARDRSGPPRPGRSEPRP